MKSKFLSKNLIAKIALVLVIVILVEFMMPEPVRAASLGGQLLSPIINLVVYLADGVISLLQSALTRIEKSFDTFDIEKSYWTLIFNVVKIIVGIQLIAGAVALMFIPGANAASPGLLAFATTVLGAGLHSVAKGAVYVAFYPQIGKKIDAALFGKNLVYPHIYITPETILSNQIDLFNINFFEKKQLPEGQDEEEQIDKTISLTNILRDGVAKVYITIRDIALVAMLIVMVYVAIRMLLALNPKEKSRYKESAVNCLIGLILIIGMHYIMSISVKLVEMVTNSISLSAQVTTEFNENSTEEEVKNSLANDSEKRNEWIEGETIAIVSEELYDAVKKEKENDNYQELEIGVDDEGDKLVYFKASNFTEQARYKAQKMYDFDNDDNTVETWEHIGWAFVYIMLVILTLAFVWMYGRRTIYMILLTIIAPILGVMYPINRINGARAHTLNLWFREYMGNLIIQPFHLVFYTILFGSTMLMALSNPIYVIIAIMGLVFSEQLLKDLLGIQDTRMGGLGKSLQDTTRAIKTTQKTTTSLIRTMKDTISRGANLISRGVGAAAQMKMMHNNGEVQNEGANKKPRQQNNPNSINRNGENPPPLNDPPGAGGLNPAGLNQQGAGGLDQPGIRELNNTNNPNDPNNPQVQPKTAREKLLRDKQQLEQAINGMQGQYESNGNGKLTKPKQLKQYENDLKKVNAQLSALDKEDRKKFLLKDKKRLQELIKKEEAEGRGNGVLARTYRNDLAAVNEELAAIGYNEINAMKENNILDPETLKAVDELNSGANLGSENQASAVENNRLDNDTVEAVNQLNGQEKLGNNNQIRMADGKTSKGQVSSSQNYSRIEKRKASLLNDKKGLEAAIKEEERKGVRNSPELKEYRRELDAVNKELASIGYSDKVKNADANKVSSTMEFEDSTISMVNDLGNNQNAFNVIAGGDEELIKTDGEREVLKDKNGNLRIQPSAGNPNGKDPMAMASGAEKITSIDVGANQGARIMDTSEDTIKNRGAHVGTTSTITGAGTTFNGTPSSSQSIPDGNKNSSNVRTENVGSSSSTQIPPFSVVDGGLEQIDTDNTQTRTVKTPSSSRAINSSSSGNRKSSSGSTTTPVSRGSGSNEVNVGTSNPLSDEVKTIWTPDGEVPVGINNISNESSTNIESSNSSTYAGSTQGSSNHSTSTGGRSSRNNSAGSNSTSTRTTNIPDNIKFEQHEDKQAEARVAEEMMNKETNTTQTETKTSDEKKLERVEKAVRGVNKVKNVTSEATKRTAGVIGAGVEGVIDAALNAVTGNVGGTVNAATGIVTDAVTIATGGTVSSSSGGSSSSSRKSKSSSKTPSQNVQTIINETKMSEGDAKALEKLCKAEGIYDDRNMAEIGRVYNKAKPSEKKEIIALSKVLYEAKRNGEDFEQAKKVLKGRVESSTIDAFKKMYDKLKT